MNITLPKADKASLLPTPALQLAVGYFVTVTDSNTYGIETPNTPAASVRKSAYVLFGRPFRVSYFS